MVSEIVCIFMGGHLSHWKDVPQGRLLEFYTEGGYKDLLSAFFNMIRFCRFIIAAALCCSYMLFFYSIAHYQTHTKG